MRERRSQKTNLRIEAHQTCRCGQRSADGFGTIFFDVDLEFVVSRDSKLVAGKLKGAMLPQRKLAFSGVLLLIACLSSLLETVQALKPNIVFILVDDLGYTDFGYKNGGEIDTPNLDAIAHRGIDFTRYYVHCVCSPSRAALMTGRYSHHTGVHNWLVPVGNIGVGLDEVFISEKMKEAGYATHMVGKWHLGHHKWDYLPNYRGFDSYYGMLTGGGCYFMGRANAEGFWYQYIETTAPKCNVESCARIPWEAQTKYSTETFSEKAVEVIDRHAAAYNSQPLFLYVAYQAVHAGGWQFTQVPPHYVDPYLDRMKPGKRQQFAGMVAALDSGIGNITSALERNGYTDENTLIIVSTDNGGPIEPVDATGSSNRPFRGGKHSLYEGGVRGLGFVAGYGIQRKNTTYAGLMHITDWFATLADVAGYSLDTKKPLDSVSHWAKLSAPESFSEEDILASPMRTEVVLGNSSDHGIGFAMLVDDEEGRQWKIVTGTPGFPNTWGTYSTTPEEQFLADKKEGVPCPNNFCLYEISSDPEERHNLSTDPAYKQVLKKLKKVLLDEFATSHDLVADCDIKPVSKVEEHVNHAWWPYCDSTSAGVEK